MHTMLGRIAGSTGIAAFCLCGKAFYGVSVQFADARFDAHVREEARVVAPEPLKNGEY